MNLIIDVGNSFVKLAVFKGEKLKYRESVELDDTFFIIKALKEKHPAIEKAIISSVGKLKKRRLML